VQVLNGAGVQGLAAEKVPVIEATGAVVTETGNADGFEYPTTQVFYSDPAQEQAATQLRDAIGLGETVLDAARVGDGAQITVILGEDAAA
jgi:hypothetical protein